MDLVVQAILIGVLQGLTEFIPISSTGHLIFATRLTGLSGRGLIGSLAFDVFLHLGTLTALIAYFWRDWIRLARAFFASLGERRIGDDPDRRLAWLLALATVPAAVIGFLGEDFVAEVLHGGSDAVRLAIAAFLVVGALGLLAADRWGRRSRDLGHVHVPTALVVGFSPALALLPGISRSGATITAGLAMGLTREAAARFSFLLATPITLGAGLYGSRDLLGEAHTSTEWLAIGGGFVAAALAGLLAIGFLLSWLRRRSVALFSLYRVGFAVLVVTLVLLGR